MAAGKTCWHPLNPPGISSAGGVSWHPSLQNKAVRRTEPSRPATGWGRRRHNPTNPHTPIRAPSGDRMPANPWTKTTPTRRPLAPGLRMDAAACGWGVRGQGRAAGSLRHLAGWPFQTPRTPPGVAENPVFASFGARPCSTRDLSVFHRLDAPPKRRQARRVRKRPSDRLRRRPSRGPLSPLAGDTY